MKSLSRRHLYLCLSSSLEVASSTSGSRIRSRYHHASRWLIGASLTLLLAYCQTLSSQAKAPNPKKVAANDLFYSPFAVAVDGSGNVYIDDNYNNRVIKEAPSGGSYKQSTVVCCELSNSSGVEWMQAATSTSPTAATTTCEGDALRQRLYREHDRRGHGLSLRLGGGWQRQRLHR